MAPRDDDLAVEAEPDSQQIDSNAVLLDTTDVHIEAEGADLAEENKVLEQYMRELPAAEWVDVEEQPKAYRSNR
jgi:hypothetical protein